MFSPKHNDTKSGSFWLGENKRNTMTVNEQVVKPVLHLYDLDPKSHLVKSELLLDKCFLNQDLQALLQTISY